MVGIWGNSPSGLPIDSAHTYSERDRNLEYTKISPTQITNVYTAFLPYYMDHGGMPGVIGLMFLVGFLSTYVYRCAIHGNCWAVFTLGAFVYATVMTIFSEEYFAQVMFWIKAGGLSTLVYFAPSITQQVGPSSTLAQIQTSMSRSPNRARSRLHRRGDGAQRQGAGAPIHRPPQPAWHRGARVPPALGKHTAPALRPPPAVDSGHGGVSHRSSHLLLEGRRDLDIPPVAARLCPPPGHGQAAHDPGRG